MQKKISEEEIEFLEAFHDPTAMMECLIPKNIRASHLWGEEDCEGIDVRPYQQPMLNYSYLYADDDRLNEKDNFQRRKGAGDLINIGSRNIGKSFVLICDEFFTSIHYDGDESCVASFDFAHLKKIGQPIVDLIKYHPFFNIFKRPKVNSARWTGGGFDVDTITGHITYGRNEQVEGADPGTAFHGLHYKTLRFEEFSYSSVEGNKKRIDSGNSYGYISRLSGIPDLRLGSPLGDILYDDSKKPWVCRLPQYVREDWSEKEKQERIKEYNGENSLSYILNVEAELVEGAFGYFDMERLKSGCYNPKKSIKFFEIGKKNYSRFEKEVIVEPMACEQTLVCFKEGTEILTENGWKDFRDVSENDLVLTLDKEKNNSYFNKINKVIRQDFDGDMIEYDSDNLKFSVTPDHQMLIERPQRYEKSKHWTFVDAKDLKVNHKIKRDLGKLKQKHQNKKYKIVKFRKREKSWYRFELNDWLEFLGWYLSEGCVSKHDYSIHISQKKISQRNKIRDLLKRMNIRFFEGSDFFRFNAKYIHAWLKENCYVINSNSRLRRTTYYNCYNKKMPDFVRNLSSDKINIILESYLLGDGWRTADNRSALSTTSYKLASDLHELILKTGKIATIQTKPSGERRLLERDYISKCVECFVVYYWKKNTKSKIRETNISRVYYKGKVYCVETCPHHTIYVRYKGKSFWSGNCSDIGTTGTPSEICIFFGNAELFKWRYNIALQKLTTQEQAKVFKWLYDKFENCIISLDATSADGRAIADDLEIAGVPKKNIVRCLFNSNIIVGFETEKDPNNPENDIVLTDNKGEPIYKYENTLDWANMELEKNFYEGLVEIPHNEKFLKQIQGYFCVKTGNRSKYGSKTEDHLLQSMQCYSIARFQNYNVILHDKENIQSTFLGGF